MKCFLPARWYSSIKGNRNSLKNFQISNAFLDELLVQEPVLKRSVENTLSYEARTELSQFKFPADQHQIEESIQDEFGETITATDWKEYNPLEPSINAAGKMAFENALFQKASLIKGVKEKKGDPTLEELKQECDTLWNEAQTGDISRWKTSHSTENLDLFSELNAMNVVKMAIDSNPSLHPSIRQAFAQTISNYCQSEVKK
jgi:hypothetical protein